MLALAYLVLFLALSAALTWWRITSYQRRYRIVPIRPPRPQIRRVS